MGSRQKGGVHTQKVSVTLGIIALLMFGAFICCTAVSADETEPVTATVNIEPGSDYCGVSKTVSYVLRGDSSYYYEAELQDESGKTGSGSVSPASGSLYTTEFTRTITVTAPSTAGDYMLVVKFYESSSKKDTVLAEKSAPLKVVDPIKLTFTLKNEGKSDITFSAYFKINGVKVDDSVQTVTVTADGTKDVTYDYYVKDVTDTTYSLESDNEIIKSSITGLGEEKTFYSSDADYSMITTIVVIVLIFLVVVLFFLLRRPVVNTGKPKGRR